MKYLLLALCLLALSCATKLPPPMPPPTPPPAPPPGVVNYWFSAQQKQTLAAIGQIDGQRFHVMLVDGREYTECHAAAEPIGRFTDYVLVASTATGPCGRNDGDWE